MAISAGSIPRCSAKRGPLHQEPHRGCYSFNLAVPNIGETQSRSLADVHESVSTDHVGTLKRMMAFAGPAYLISVGYMDPGNWATDLVGGSYFGYRLLWVLVMSNAMAILLQTLSARLGIV